MDLGYARVSTAKQDLDRQVEALVAAGVARDKIFLDKKSGATTDRPGLRAVLEYAREGDVIVIVVHTLDRLSRTVRDTLNLIHDLTDRGVGVCNLADPSAPAVAVTPSGQSHLAPSATSVSRAAPWRLRCAGGRPQQDPAFAQPGARGGGGCLSRRGARVGHT